MKRNLLCYLLFLSCILLQAQNITPQFSIAGYYPLQDTGRDVQSMNLAWRFHKGDVAEDPSSASYDDSDWQVVTLPHGLEYLPLDASGGPNYQGIAWYRKHFTPSLDKMSKKSFIHLEGVMGKSQIWVNGQLMKEHYGGYTPIIIDVTDVLRPGQDNVVAVKADNSDDGDYPVGKPQSLLDFSYFGGIYRDCWFITHDDLYITDANYENEVAGGGSFVWYNDVNDKSADVNIKTHLRNASQQQRTASVQFQLRDNNGKLVANQQQKINLAAGASTYAQAGFTVKNPRLWSPEDPNLYYMDILVKDAKGKVIDGYRKRIGIRGIEFRQEDGLWINGKPYGKIMGTNRHQDFAVIGNAMPNVLQWRDAKKLRDAGLKVIRTHYIIDPAFMDACDELGLFALVETPGWQFWNDDPLFAERVYSDIRQMIRIHRNHASLFFWEPVLNETHYPASFAKNAAQICKEEYPYPYSIAACDDAAQGDEYFDLLLRPTRHLKPGKTYFTREWGDNVDDWNAHNSNSRVARNWGETPMLIQAQHYADRYSDVYNQASQVVGGCFWHSFDHQRGYHPDPFYGGIMDAFRQPKTAYYLFMSQRNPAELSPLFESGPMVYIAHEMTPFSPADVTVYSNCDEVRLTVFEGGKQYHYTKEANTKLPSPVITFPEAFDFMAWKRLYRAEKHEQCYLLAEGLINGEVVATHKRYPAERADHIRLRLDDEGTGLIANGSDIVTVIAEVVDKKGIVKRLNNSYIQFTVDRKSVV